MIKPFFIAGGIGLASIAMLGSILDTNETIPATITAPVHYDTQKSESEGGVSEDVSKEPAVPNNKKVDTEKEKIIKKPEDFIKKDLKESVSSNCHPSYSGCLKVGEGDYDCAGGSGNGPNYTGKVQVFGYDEFGLDRDKDGWGCE